MQLTWKLALHPTTMTGANSGGDDRVNLDEDDDSDLDEQSAG